MGDFIELVAVVLGLSIPLSVIYGIFHLRSKKLSMKQFLEEERQVLLELKRENVELKNRLDRLEGLPVGQSVKETAIEDDYLKLEENQEMDLATQLEILAQKHRVK